jgi:hypothetical protein
LPDDLPFTNLLSFGYYRHSCPDLERIINRKLKHWIHKDPTLAPSLIRLHFHDCAVTVLYIYMHTIYNPITSRLTHISICTFLSFISFIFNKLFQNFELIEK